METVAATMTYGARVRNGKVEFRVWAPAARRVRVQFGDGRSVPMERSEDGTFSAAADAQAGHRYFYQLDDNHPVPDPVSRFLPAGVHGPTEIVDPDAFRWSDRGWRGLDLRDYIIYELHTGTFTPQGTFDAIPERFDYLKQLGITVIELMPVIAFPGRRNWGYDGVSMYAVQESYGGPEGLKRLVDSAHRAGLAVILDVIYNHLGNEGNYLRMFGPYFTDRHKTPWGEAVNYDGPGCEGVRRYVVENALYWIREYHLDGLRLDAIQTIKDDSRYHIVQEIRDRVHQLGSELGRQVCVIGESDENNPRDVLPNARGGFGLDAVWSDDFHHAVHAVLTGEHEGYYQDFGRKEQIVRALNDGLAFQGEHFKFWGAPRGSKPEGVSLEANVICIQNHDQVGNRAQGERLGHLVPAGAVRLAAALLLLAPETPLLFMGEEFAASSPFQFFTDYRDPVLQKAVSEGRRNEFKDFTWNEVPDPQDPATFERSKLRWEEASDENPMLRWYRQLIALRKQYVTGSERTCRAWLEGGNIVMQVPREQPRIMVLAEFADRAGDLQAPAGWREALANDEDGFRVRVLTRE
ncbi:MAG: malto-oligosyltrehalose trehalohydrolase [Terriglobales bacterium]